MATSSHSASDSTRPGNSDQSFESEDCRQRYRRLFERAPMVAYSLDSGLRTLYISPYCLRVFGFSADEIQEDHQFWDHHLHPEDRQRVLYQRERHLKNGKGYTLEYRIIHRDQSVRHIINHTIPVFSGDNLDGIDGFVFDITRRKYLEEQLVVTERIKVLNDMSQGVAHEIRNPLTSIGGFARLLDRRMAMNDPNRLHLEIILKEVSRLEATLNRILNTLRPINLNRDVADINEIITRVLAQMHHEFHQKEVTVSTSLSGEIPHIKVDQLLMGQALHSMLEATLQGLDTGGELAVSTARNHHHLTIEITGVRLDSKPLDDSQLFFPFYREPAFDHGVGLPLSQQIISEHGGNVVMKNGYEQSASLVITLPIPRPHSKT